jgi:hypothetical protein
MTWEVEYTDEFVSAARSIGRSDPVTQSFKKLRNEMPASRQASIAARTDELLATLPLHEIRQARKLSQDQFDEN